MACKVGIHIICFQWYSTVFHSTQNVTQGESWFRKVVRKTWAFIQVCSFLMLAVACQSTWGISMEHWIQGWEVCSVLWETWSWKTLCSSSEIWWSQPVASIIQTVLSNPSIYKMSLYSSSAGLIPSSIILPCLSESTFISNHSTSRYSVPSICWMQHYFSIEVKTEYW